MNLRRQTEIPSSRTAEERAGLYPPRLRGLGLDAVRRLRPRFDLGFDHRSLLRTVDRTASGGEAFRHRLFVEDPDLFSRQFARLQFRSRPDALGPHRGQSRQSRPDLSRGFRRRRFRLDRFRPVRPCHPPRRQHGLYRREQRRLRPDQRPVLGHRRPRLEIQTRRGQHATTPSTWSASRCKSAPLSSAAGSPATRRSSRR